MKASELRIGNSIKINGQIIESIGYMVIMDLAQINKGITNDYLKNLKHEPILLTEEILLEFGFTKGLFGHYHFTLANGFSRLSIFGLTRIELCNTSGTMWGYVGCTYLHQLQNLYFALTGEELTIKQK